jgi:hypothetical protein
MNGVERLKLDKKTLTIVPLGGLSDDRAYWLSRTPAERLQAVEILRQLNYGQHQSAARLQRILEVAQRASG